MGSGEGGGGDTVISAVISRSSSRSRRLHGRFVLGLMARTGAGEHHGAAKPQVSGLYRVRVSVK